MIYKIYKINNIKEKKKEEQILNVASINWNNTKFEDIFIYFDFTTTNGDLMPGDWIGLFAKHLALTDDINFGEKIVFYGIITKKEPLKAKKDNVKGLYQYTGYDLGYFLDKKAATGQSKNDHPINTIKKVCTEIDIEPGEILKGYENNKNLSISKTYTNEKATNILNDIYELLIKNNKEIIKDEYYYDCMDGKLNLLKYEKNNNLKGYIANAFTIDSLKTIHSHTITQTLDEKENTINDEINLNTIGDYNIKKGVIFDLKNKELNLDGEYLIETTNHTISGVKEEVNIKITKLPKFKNNNMDIIDTRFV